MLTLLLRIGLFLYSPLLLAENLGEIAGNATGPVLVASTFMQKVTLGFFVGFLSASILQYIARKRNPEIPASRPAWMFIFALLAGLFLVAQIYRPPGY